MPDTPQARPLPGAQTEAARLAQLLPRSLTLTGPRATRDAVLAALPHHHIVHLACHSFGDWNDPASSTLLLHDHLANPFTVTTLSQLHLTDADLAYLSACETTYTTQRLADEAVHITAAFQLAGFRNVIGTLWPIRDSVAADIADKTYTILTNNGTTTPDTKHTAHALHTSIRQLRNSESIPNPAIWAAYIHAGI